MRHKAVATPPPAAAGGWTLDLSDDFERADGNQTGWVDITGSGGTWGCYSGRMTGGGFAFWTRYRFSSEASGDDIAVEVDCVAAANSADHRVAVRANAAINASSYIEVRLEAGTIQFPAAGTTVVTGLTYGANPTLRVEVVGTDVEIFVDGVSVHTGTTAVTGGAGNRHVGGWWIGAVALWEEVRVYVQ